MFQFGASAPGGGMDNETARRLFESLFGGGGGMDFSYSDTTGVVEECQVAAWVLVRALHSETEGNASVLNRKGVD